MSIGWVAAGTAVAGAYSANKQAKASKNATAAASDAAAQEIALSREALDWYKEVYNRESPQRERATETANQVAEYQLQSMRDNDAIAQDYWNYQKQTFRPLEQGLVNEAQNYATEARKNQAAGTAMADVSQQFDAARQAQARGMTRMGVNPNDGRMAAMSNQLMMSEALGKAQAGTQARNNVDLQGYARKMDAANLGRNLASSQATSAGVAMNAGNNATNNAMVPVNMGQSAGNFVGNGFNTALQGFGSASNTFGKIAGNQSGNDIWGSLGNLAGQFAGSKAGSEWITRQLG
jgi:hypothetical protein